MVEGLLDECIIAASTFGTDTVLAKNRDRAYKPKLEIRHLLVNGIEIAVLHDRITGWIEGINQFGIGVVNTSLLVGFDEKEKQIVKKNGKKSKDGIKILKGLSCNNIEDTVHILMTYRGGVKGHTFVADSSEGVAIENTSKHTATTDRLDLRKLTVRTNHGHHYPDAGYTEGNKYLSSKIRKMSAEKVLDNVDDYRDVARALRKRFYPRESMLNMTRRTEHMNTTSQIVLNLTRKEMLVYLFPDQIKDFSGLHSTLPNDYVPQIRIRVFVIKDY